eukprot:GFKZ01012998.1.p1 GENE.GFKZ01012998.1~~GFKZ01012998.1.p1  ORF type:complete len:1086 (+),score=175.22 GFKZ01012998.1:92-3349(+)
MPNSPLSGLGVRAADVASVENNVLAEAEADALRLEATEHAQLLRTLDSQLIELRKQEAILSKGRFSTAANRQLQALRKRILNAEDKRKGLMEAAEARREIRRKIPEQAKTLQMGQGESEREFLIRTGKVTPFDGQRGYERRQAEPVRRIKTVGMGPGAVAEAQPKGAEEASRPFKRPRTDAEEQKQRDRSELQTSTTNGQQSPIGRVEQAGKASGSDEDEYIPDESERDDGDDGEDEDWGPGEEKSSHRKRKSHRKSDLDFGADADAELDPGADSRQDAQRKSEEQLEGSDWEPENDEEIEFAGGLRIPGSIYDRLFDYQKTGVQWLWELHSQGTGGILGDEMGLGKTVQIVAFLAALDYSEKLTGSVIIIAPTTVLRQWYREFRSWWPRFRVRILHHSEDQQRSSGGRVRANTTRFNPEAVIEEVSEKRHGVLITSYEQVRKHHERLLEKFDYVIADEGHKMKSPDAEITLVCKRFDTPHRIIVSGSPLQNHLKELWSLFDFVYPGKLGTLPVFQAQFIVPITMGGYSTASKAQVHTAFKCSLVLRDLVSPYLLRRMKKDVATQLPEKNEQILFVKLTLEQREKYKAFLKSRFVRQVLSGKLNLLYAITALRKICNHADIPLHNNDHDSAYIKNGTKRARNSTPVFISDADKEDPSQIEDYGNWRRSGKMVVLDRILDAWREAGCRVLLFSQTKTMLDILEARVKTKGFSYQRMDGDTPVGSRMNLIDNFNRDESVFVFLLTTRVGGLGVNLTGADRVVLFDPDWNPSTDLQARERAWRVGQTRPVTVYRLVTSGTIEEKIYHRQIYKQFLTNKVLNDPRQRRFFKQKDIKDLFTLGGEDEHGTETGDIFSGTSAKEQTGPRAAASGKDDSEGIGQRSDAKNPEEGNASLLNSLLDDSGDGALQSTMNHDAILVAGTEVADASLVEHEADAVASKALEELKRSAHRRRREGVGVPTWTGKSGLAGFVSSRQSGGGGSSKAASLLQRIRQREGAGAAGNGVAENGNMSASATLLHDIIQFFRRNGGQSTSGDVVKYFQARVESDPNGAQGFKSLLKQVAVLKRGEGPRGLSVWKLLSKFANDEAS